MPMTQYRWALTWNTALNSLKYVENELNPYNGGIICAPISQPLEQFPVVLEMESGEMDGGGRRSLVWTFEQIRVEALRQMLTLYFGSGATLSVKMTINQRNFTTYSPDTDTYTRYNVYAQKPLFNPNGMLWRAGIIANAQILFTIDGESS